MSPATGDHRLDHRLHTRSGFRLRSLLFPGAGVFGAPYTDYAIEPSPTVSTIERCSAPSGHRRRVAAGAGKGRRGRDGGF